MISATSADVALGAVDVVQKSNTCGTDRVILDVCNGCWNTIFIVTTEVDHAILTLVSTTDVTSSDTT